MTLAPDLSLPEEPVELRRRTRALIEEDPDRGSAAVVDAGAFLADPLWGRWGPALEAAGMDRDRFDQVVAGYRRELWLWVRASAPGPRAPAASSAGSSAASRPTRTVTGRAIGPAAPGPMEGQAQRPGGPSITSPLGRQSGPDLPTISPGAQHPSWHVQHGSWEANAICISRSPPGPDHLLQGWTSPFDS